MQTRALLPSLIALIMVLLLLVPMYTAVRWQEGLAPKVDALRLEWLRMAVDPNNFTDAALESFTKEIESSRLHDLARFSATIDDSLSQLPDTVDQMHPILSEQNANQFELIAHVQEVDALLSRIHHEATVLDAQRDSAYSSLVTFALLVAAGFALLWLYQFFQVQSLIGDRVSSERVSALEHRVQDHERRRIARELHDGAAQELAVARMTLDRLDSTPTVTALRSAIESAAGEIRLAYRAMDPRFTDPDEFATMLRELASNIEHRSGQHFDVHISATREISWDSQTQLHLFRVAQEALHNVVRHAQATYASLSLEVTDNTRVILRVEDNGIGIGDAPEGYGRRGIRERVELMHGNVAWQRRDTGGTIMQAVIPLGTRSGESG